MPKPKGHTRIKLWDRQPKEHDAAWEAFKKYRDTGLTRSTTKLAKEIDRPIGTVLAWSSRFSWVVRAAAWDAEQDRLDQLWLQEERRKALTRHVKQAQQLHSKWLNRLQQLDPAQLSPSDVIRYADVATRMEREALSMASEVNVNHTGVVSLQSIEALSPEDTRMRMVQLKSEMEARLQEASRGSEESVFNEGHAGTAETYLDSVQKCRNFDELEGFDDDDETGDDE